MILERWKALAIVALSLLGFLMSALLLKSYEMNYQTLPMPQSPLKFCEGAEICSEPMPFRSTNKESAALDEISLRMFYDKLVKRGVGRRNGTKRDIISLVSAVEQTEQIYVFMMSEKRFGDPMYCRYFDHQQKEIGPASKGVVFPEFTANCVRREGAKYMSLTDSASGSYEFPVPIINRAESVITHYFSACLAPLYGAEPKWLLLAEFIEHHKIQGVTYFYIYVIDIDDYSRKLLDDYVRTGEAEVKSLPDRLKREPKIWQLPQLQECLIRARGHSRWVALIDLDERLTTTEYSGTLSDFLQKISDPTIAEVSFRQRWVPRNETTPEKYVNGNQVAELMPTWRYNKTSPVAKVGFVAKYIVDPKKVISVDVHFVNMFYDGYRRHFMNPEEAVVRHYRDAHADSWQQHWLARYSDMSDFTVTHYPEAHMKTLRANVQRRLHHVYGGMTIFSKHQQ